MTKIKKTTYEEVDQKPQTIEQPTDPRAAEKVTWSIRDSISEILEINRPRQEADSKLTDTQENLRQSSYDVLVNKVNAAKKAGVNVSDIEAQMPELLKQIQNI